MFSPIILGQNDLVMLKKIASNIKKEVNLGRGDCIGGQVWISPANRDSPCGVNLVLSDRSRQRACADRERSEVHHELYSVMNNELPLIC